MNTVLRAAALAALFVLTAQAGAARADEVVARIGETDIPASRLKEVLATLDPALRQQAAADPQVLARIVRAELARLVVLDEAREREWDKKPEIQARIERARTQAIVATYLESLATPPAAFPSDAEIAQAYELNRDAFLQPRQYRVAQIFLQVAAGERKADEAAKKRADDLSKRARAKPAEFEDLARKSSEHESKKSGGDLGWIPEPRLLPELRAVVAGLEKGEVSEPVRSASGWHVVKLLDTKAAAPRPLAEVRDTIAGSLRQQRAQELEQAYVAQLLEKRGLAVNEIALRKLLQDKP